MLAGASLALIVLLPGVSHAHSALVIVISGLACCWGACSFFQVAWERTPWWLIHASTVVGGGLIATVIASSGGASSPTWLYLFFLAVFASSFFPPPAAAAYLVACVAVQALPLLYDGRALHNVFLAQLVIATASYAVLGTAITSGKSLMLRLRRRAERLASEQGSLRRVATGVVGGDSAERIYELVAVEAAALLGAGAAGIMRLDGPRSMTVTGSWADHPGGRYDPGTVVEVTPGSEIEQVLETELPVRIKGHRPESPVGRLGYSSSIVAPIRVAAGIWGVLAVTSSDPARFTGADEQRLTEFGDLLATAITSLEHRANLAAQASSDPLTGLANHRTLHARLAAELARAVRHQGLLSVAVIDIDNFKQLNDAGGHELGDELLVAVAGCLRRFARTEDTLGRIGGDEFAWILPDTSREAALVAVERVRRTIAATVHEPFRITVSAGICDTTVISDPAELIRFADGALYWSKAHGRNQSWIYDPGVVEELSAQERAERLERSQALVGLRALARAIDAKDPATREHSERVSTLVGRLARAAGWTPEQALILSEAALVHDVGKIGIPEMTLRKASPLTEAERAQIRGHPELAARIVNGVLAPEQVEWIHTHRERPDGTGYPQGLRESEIPDGAALLAVADAWDVMTFSRPDGRPKNSDEALAECTALIGGRFTRAAVAALSTLHAAGELPAPPALPLSVSGTATTPVDRTRVDLSPFYTATP
jgi:diguanylate cyclase (GGDEF)-like protein